MFDGTLRLAWSIVLAAFAATESGSGDLSLDWWSVDGGGVMRSTGGDFELSGTIGQPDAGPPLTSPTLVLTGGFWFQTPAGDCNTTGYVDLVDYAELEACLAGPATTAPPGCVCFDVDQSNTVDLRDFADVQTTFGGP